MIGTTLAHYRITGELGAGGMGEVWRAEDTKLGREVALKVLPAEFAEDPDRMARFEREDLSERIKRGAIPVDEAIPIALQTAEALEAATDPVLRVAELERPAGPGGSR